MAQRVRVLNIWSLCGGPLPLPPPTTGSWDLEAELPVVFAKQFPSYLQQATAFIPQPTPVPYGWLVSIEPSFIRPYLAARLQFVSTHPPLPYVILVSVTTVTPGSNILTFASVPAFVIPGMVVRDSTVPSAISGSTKVLSTTATQVTLTAVTLGTVSAGDNIVFTY